MKNLARIATERERLLAEAERLYFDHFGREIKTNENHVRALLDDVSMCDEAFGLDPHTGTVAERLRAAERRTAVLSEPANEAVRPFLGTAGLVEVL